MIGLNYSNDTILLMGGCHIARGETFARGDTFAREDTFARRHFLHDVTFLWQNFCKASLLHGVVFLQKYLYTAKTINNQTIFYRALFCTLL